MRRIFAFLLVLFSMHSFAQQVPDFTLPNTVDGKPVSLKDCKASPGVVILFTSNSCPYDSYYYERMKKIAANSKVTVLLVNAHTGDGESVAAMKAKAAELGLNVPYLADKEQVLMKSLHATKSPQAFVLKNSGGQFSVFYQGAIDDNAQVEADVHETYLQNAINALLGGQKPAAAEVRPVGCVIRKRA